MDPQNSQFSTLNQVSPIAPPTPTPTPLPPKSSGVLVTLIIILLVLILAALGWWYRQGQRAPEVIAEPIAVETATEPIATLDPTADWQTYRNEEYGFEFKYPIGLVPYNGFVGDRAVEATAASQVVNVSPSVKLHEDVPGKEIVFLSIQVNKSVGRSSERQTGQEITFGGTRASLVDGEGNMGSVLKTIHVESGGNWFIIIQNFPNSLLDQILSTFRFLD